MREIDCGDAVEQRLQTLLKEGPNVFADSKISTMALPEYYDPMKFRCGQNVFKNNIFTMMIAKLSGLLLLLAIPSILKILKFTKQSGTPCASFRRYASTILHTCIWYKNSPDQDIEFFVSLKNVRKKHCVASRRSNEAGIGRISQLDMALTQFGFMGFTLLSAKRLGICATDDELEGLLHFWRVVACMLGTEERFNLCNGSVKECTFLCERLLEEVFVPHLAEKNKDFDEMSDVLLEGLWPINPFINNKAFKLFTNHLIISAIPNNNHSLNIDDRSLPIKKLSYRRLIVVIINRMPTSSRRNNISRELRHRTVDNYRRFYFCDWESNIGYGVAISLAVFEAKRLLIIILELFIKWNVIRIAGGYQPVIYTVTDIFVGFITAIQTITTLRKYV
ncbi:hypothetical protein PV326_002050 [Microctonus aethiopoides]|nr:hypothetical protein PV326_002050 [Microctonus aethiopoides]